MYLCLLDFDPRRTGASSCVVSEAVDVADDDDEMGLVGDRGVIGIDIT